MIEHLLNGFATACSFTNLLYCFFGVTMGTIIGVLPGIGPVAGTAMLIPFTFGMNPTTAVICSPASTTGPCTAVRRT